MLLCINYFWSNLQHKITIKLTILVLGQNLTVMSKSQTGPIQAVQSAGYYIMI